MTLPRLLLQLPGWVAGFLPPPDTVYPAIEDRMRLVIELARQNIRHKTGGPFGAGIFDMKTRRLVAPGINLVMSVNCSILHGEMVAITLAQQHFGTYDLGSSPDISCELVTSTEPCAMCFGAVPWSGVRQLVCGARDADARHLGFDEGPKPADWIAPLEQRGIRVIRDVMRDDAVRVLREYAETGGIIYNSRQGETRP